MQIEVINTLPRLQEIRGDWSELVSSFPDEDIFVSPEWFFAWWEVFSAKKTLFFLALWEDEKLCGLAPFFKARKGPLRYIHFAGYPHISDRVDVLALPGRAKECLETLAKFFRDRKDWDILFLRQFSPRRGNAEIFERALRDLGFPTALENDGRCLYIDLRQYEGREDYMKQVLGRRRQNYLRRVRRLREMGDVKWEVRRRLDDRLLDEMVELDARKSLRGRIGKSFLGDPLNIEFLKRVTTILGRERFLLDALRIGRELVAYHALFVTGKSLGAYQSAYHMNYAKLGVGVQITMKAIERGFELGFEEFDFLLGAEEYKTQYASLARVNKRLRVYRGGLRALALRSYYERALPLWRWGRKHWRAWRKKAEDSGEEKEEKED